MDSSDLSNLSVVYEKGLFTQKFLDLLKETGFDLPPPSEQLLWMEDVPGVEPFLKIFCSITPDSCLNQHEVTFLENKLDIGNAETVDRELDKYLGPLEERQCSWTDNDILMLEKNILSIKQEINQAKHVNHALSYEVKQKELSNKKLIEKLSEVKMTVKSLQDKSSSLISMFDETLRLSADHYATYYSQMRPQSEGPVVRLTQLSFNEFNQNNLAVSELINNTLLNNLNKKKNFVQETELMKMEKLAQMYYLRFKELETSRAEMNVHRTLLLTEKQILENCFEKNIFPSLQELRELKYAGENSSLLLNDVHLNTIDEYAKEQIKSVLVKYNTEMDKQIDNQTSTMDEITRIVKSWSDCCKIGLSLLERESKIELVSLELLRETMSEIEQFSNWFKSSKVEIKQNDKMEWRRGLISCFNLFCEPHTQGNKVYLEDVLDHLKNLSNDIHCYKANIFKSLCARQINLDFSIVKLRNDFRKILQNWKSDSLLELNEEVKKIKWKLSGSNEIDTMDEEITTQMLNETTLFCLTNPAAFITKILQLEEEEKLLKLNYFNNTSS